MSDDMITVTSQCLCKAHTFTASVEKSALPLSATPCHCDSCRHSTGALYLSVASWPNLNEDLSSLQGYLFSESLVDYSCGTCGTHMFCKRTRPGSKPMVFTGTLNDATNLIRYDNHIFVADTVDGGATEWLRKNHLDGGQVRRWKAWNESDGKPGDELPSSWPEPSVLPKPLEKVVPGSTPFHCLCRGVNLALRSAADLATTPREDLPFYIDPDTHKYLVTSCACESCRRSCGIDMMSWTYGLLTHVEFPSGSGDGSSTIGGFPSSVKALKEAVTAERKDPRLGTLALYKSSADVERYHCSRCSAQVFYAVADRPGTIEISVGLLSHPSGARAEGLLRWDYGSLSDGTNEVDGWRDAFIRQAKKEREEWREKRRYPQVWKSVEDERQKVRSVLKDQAAK